MVKVCEHQGMVGEVFEHLVKVCQHQGMVGEAFEHLVKVGEDLGMVGEVFERDGSVYAPGDGWMTYVSSVI